MALPALKIDELPSADPFQEDDRFLDTRRRAASLEATLARYLGREPGLPPGWVLPGREEGVPLPALSPAVLDWRMAEPGVVAVSVGLHNVSSEATAPGWLVIGAAPFGAFADSHDVARGRIPSLPPGARFRHTVRVTTADLGNEDTERLSARPAGGRWIGNLNVYFERDPAASIERHCAFGLRVPSCTQSWLGLYLKQEPLADDYACEIEVESSTPGWVAEVSISARNRWGRLVVTSPPVDGSECRVVARIRRERDQKVVPVEFTFETTPKDHDRLGCKR